MPEAPTSDGRPDDPATAPDTPYALQYPCGEPPAPGQVHEVAPGVLWLRMPLPFALNHINLWAVADEDDGVDDAGVGLDRLRHRHAPLPVDFQDLARAEQSRRQVVVLGGERPQALEALLDLAEEQVAAGIHRLEMRRGIAVQALEPVTGQHGAERRGDGDPPLRVEPHREVRHEAVHRPPRSTATGAPPGVAGRRRPKTRRRRNSGARHRTRRACGAEKCGPKPLSA